MGGNVSLVQRIVVNSLQPRLIPNRPTAPAGPSAEVHIFVVEEKIAVQAAELL
jgi:hypothetical protein